MPDLAPASLSDGDGLRLVFRLQFLIPSRSNDGHAFPSSFLAELEDHINEVTGAFSRRDGAVIGSWCCGSRVYRDRSREYFIDVADAGVARDLAIGLYQFIARRFDQLAVSIDVTPRFSTVLTPREHIMNLPTRLAWQPLPAPRRVFLPVLLTLVLLFARCNGPVDSLPVRATVSLRHSTISAKPSLQGVR
jgi:hypothetical protein